MNPRIAGSEYDSHEGRVAWLKQVAVKGSLADEDTRDWRRILGVAYQQVVASPTRQNDIMRGGGGRGNEDEYFGLPPHVYLARTRGASSRRSGEGERLVETHQKYYLETELVSKINHVKVAFEQEAVTAVAVEVAAGRWEVNVLCDEIPG
nr:uncharacterized protein LOC109152898 [Ipomoea batatas]